MPAQCWNRNMAPMERERDALRSVLFRWAAIGFGVGDEVGVGVLNFSLLYRQLWLHAFWRRRVGSMTPTTGGLPARVTRTCVYIWLMWFYFRSHYLGVGSPDAEPGSGNRAPGVSRGLRRSARQPAHTAKRDKTVSWRAARRACILLNWESKVFPFFMLIFAIPFICIHNAQWSQVAQKSYRISNTTYPNEILNSFDFSPT